MSEMMCYLCNFSYHKKTYRTWQLAAFGDNPLLSEFDNTLRSGLTSILNVDLSENQWTQASLPVGVPVWCLLFLVNICLLISYSVRKVLEFSPLSRTWKVLEISVGSGKFWKFDVIVLQSSWICCVSNWIICITLCMCSVKELLNVLMKWCILVSPAFHTVSYYIRVTSKDIMHHC